MEMEIETGKGADRLILSLFREIRHHVFFESWALYFNEPMTGRLMLSSRVNLSASNEAMIHACHASSLMERVVEEGCAVAISYAYPRLDRNDVGDKVLMLIPLVGFHRKVGLIVLWTTAIQTNCGASLLNSITQKARQVAVVLEKTLDHIFRASPKTS